MTNYEQERPQIEAFRELSEKAVRKLGSFFKKAFRDAKESAKKE